MRVNHQIVSPGEVLKKYPPGSSYLDIGSEDESIQAISNTYYFDNGKPIRKPVVTISIDKDTIVADGSDSCDITMIISFKPDSMRMLNVSIDGEVTKMPIENNMVKFNLDVDLPGQYEIKAVGENIRSGKVVIKAV